MAELTTLSEKFGAAPESVAIALVIARRAFPVLVAADDAARRAAVLAQPEVVALEQVLVAAGFPPLEDQELGVLSLAYPPADLTLVPLLRRGWVVSLDPEGCFHLSGEHAALAGRILMALGCKDASASDRWLSNAGWLLTITVDGREQTFFSMQPEPEEWANLDLVVGAVRAVVGTERVLEVATGDQTAGFLCLPVAAQKVLRGAGYLCDRPRLSRVRRNKNIVEVAAAELETLTGEGGTLPQQ